MMVKCRPGQNSFKLCGILLLTAALLCCPVPVTADAGEVDSAVSGANTAVCKGLKPFNNIDELLYQFYINLESDCLFEMSTAELEKVWNIKILDEERAKPKNYYPLSETEFYQKPYKTEKDAFYMERGQGKIEAIYGRKQHFNSNFTLKPTKEYMEKHGGFFSDGKLPQLTPERVISTNLPGYTYKSSDKTRSILVNFGWTGEIEIVKNSEQPVIKNNDGKISDETLGATAGKAGDTPCRGLKPFNNLDELLYQFYINLDSDCLFYMPIAELEKVWGIKILSDERSEPGKFKASDFAQKPYKSEKDAFYLEAKGGREGRPYTFDINMTDEYSNEHTTLLTDGKYPRILPEPQRIFAMADGASSFSSSMFNYYWINSTQTRMIYLDSDPGVTSIRITDYITPAFKKGE